MSEYVILVNEHDEALGKMEKLEAHQKGVLHRAFSVILFNENGDLLLQKRASHKYHSPGLWTNSCCSHPRPGETVLDAAHRRMREELGISTVVEPHGHFIYKASFENGLIENELDHILIGQYNNAPSLNPEEAEGWQYMSIENLEQDLERNPNDYTVWFKLILPRIQHHVNKSLTA